jgi:hypothetical protein
MPTRYKYIISLIIAIIIGGNIYHRSDPPPYGYPLNELSNNYWGVIVDIAHRWRNGEQPFWNRSLGGGANLFTSGQYPLLNPTNALAWLLNDDQFYIVKLIEPYVLGLFFMMVLLWDVFKTRWYVAVFGGLAYMGLSLSKATTMAESPYFLYGCGLFPAMVLVWMKLVRARIQWAAVGVGAVLALQFLGEGATQMPQLLAWWLIFFTVHGLRRNTVMSYSSTVLIFVAATIGFCAVQLIPSLYFLNHESARLQGFYPINNFDLFRSVEGPSLTKVLSYAFITVDSVRSRIFVVLILAVLAVAARNFGRVFERVEHKKIVFQLFTATAIYMVLPTVAYELSLFLPVLKKLFHPLTCFTFRYGLHTLDFCLVLGLCLIINDPTLAIWTKEFASSKTRIIVSSVLLLLALIFCLLPVIWHSFPAAQTWINSSQALQLLPEFSKSGATKILVNSLLLLVILIWRPRFRITHVVMAVVLLNFVFMLMIECFKSYDKGCRGDISLFGLDSPEQVYYRNARGKYLIPYRRLDPPWVADNYNLLHGVNGVAGFMAVSPARFQKFNFYYNLRSQDNVADIAFKGGEAKFWTITGDIPYALTTYFPVDFTLIDANLELSWPGFTKVIDGNIYDVYERSVPTQRVYFANELQVLDSKELFKKLEEPRGSILFVANEDLKGINLSSQILKGDHIRAGYTDFVQHNDGRLSFSVSTEDDLFVVVPERYEGGWHVYVDGRRVSIFPAYYLFIGFQVPQGIHHVELRYSTPWLAMGLMINLIVFIFLFIYFIRTSNSENR